MKYKGVLVALLLVLSFASISVSTQSQPNTAYMIQNYAENYEEVGSFENPEIWTVDHGVTFKNSTSRNTSAELDEKGNMDVVWEDNRKGDWNIFYVKLRNKDGEKLINDFKVTENEKLSLNPQLTTQNEYIYVVWQEKDQGRWKLYFSKLRYSDEEITPVKERVGLLDLGNGLSKEYSFIKGENHHFHLVYEKEGENGQNIYYTQVNREGSILMEPQSISDTEEPSYKPQIRRATNGDLHVLWLEPIERNNGLFYKQIDSDANTEVNKKRLTVVKRLTRYDLTTDDEGKLHLVFDDDRYHNYKRDVIYQRLDASGKIITDDSLITQRDDDNNSFSPSITLGKQDEIYVSWADSRAYRSSTKERLNITQIPHDIYMTTINQKGEKIQSSERSTGSFSFSTNPITMTDEDNEQHLLWEDDRRDVMDIYYKRTNKPDLTVERISVEPAEPLYNSSVKAEVVVKNKGAARINTTGSFYLESERKLLSEVNISLDSKEERSAMIEFITREKGEQTLTFVANEERNKIEKDYGNNRYQTTFFTRYYDLNMTRVKGNATVKPGESGSFEYNVTNKGNVPQNIEMDVNITGPEEGVDIEHPPLDEELDTNETRGYEFNATTRSDQLAGEYTIQVTISSLDTEGVNITENFTLNVEAIYDLSLNIDKTNISDPAEVNYTVEISVTNLGNTDQEIWVYVGEGNEYAMVEGGIMILKPGETSNPTLNLTGYQVIEGDELEITVIAESQDDKTVTESETVLLEGEEKGDESLLASIPWFWIGVAVGLIVGVFIAIRVIYTVIYS